MATSRRVLCHHVAMWQPAAGWERLPGAGPATVGVWRTVVDDRPAVVKRLRRPEPFEEEASWPSDHPAYWRREAEVASAGLVEETPGLLGAECLRVDEDDEGVTLVHAYVEAEEVPGLATARCLGEFATVTAPDLGWLARGLFGTRVRAVERRGGWTTLARTPVADVADVLWRRREHHLARLAALPQVLQHGDPVPSNLRAMTGSRVVATDWATLGVGPVGGDLGYLALSVRESFEPLLDAYLLGVAAHPAGVPARDDVAFAARVVAVFTVLTRADWALARVTGGEGALAGKYRHPSIAPVLRAMQRQYPLIEALLEA